MLPPLGLFPSRTALHRLKGPSLRMALEGLAAEGRLGTRLVFWHTGGLFGVFGRGAEYAADLQPGQAL